MTSSISEDVTVGISVAHGALKPRREVATFWHGPALAKLELACLLSFVAAGFDVTVYGFEPMAGLPAGIAWRDAGHVVDRRYLSAFIVRGKPSIAHFSDLFRYRLFSHSDAVWIDADLFCLKPFFIADTGNFLAKETESSINNAILRIDPKQPELGKIIARAESFGNGVPFEWGATGPVLLTEAFSGNVLREALPPKFFYPVGWNDWWMPFTPSAKARCQSACSEAHALHLWNNIVERSGYWKDVAPPIGSFLHDELRRLELLKIFDGVYPAAVMEHIAQNYRNSRSAAHLTVKELIGITAPRIVAGIKKHATRRA